MYTLEEINEEARAKGWKAFWIWTLLWVIVILGIVVFGTIKNPDMKIVEIVLMQLPLFFLVLFFSCLLFTCLLRNKEETERRKQARRTAKA